ncbi:hypothetical protein IAE22_32930 [Bacillus sp. S34]|nr:hypothetical protein [Bacillus sp. S34]
MRLEPADGNWWARATIPEIGDPAPGFSLPGMIVRDGTRLDDEYSLSAEIGRTLRRLRDHVAPEAVGGGVSIE